MNQVMLKNGTVLPVEQLTIADLQELKKLQTKVIETLPEKNFLQPLTDEEFIYILSGNGVLIGVKLEEKLIAFRAMLDPGDDPEHLGKDVGVPNSEWSSILYSEITNVDPAFQGNGLQRQLGHIIMETVDAHKYRYICTTVSPYNIASIKDKFGLGLSIRALTVKYKTLIRYVMMKELTHEICVEEDSILVSMGATEEQQQLLKTGYIGTRIHASGDDWLVTFNKQVK